MHASISLEGVICFNLKCAIDFEKVINTANKKKKKKTRGSRARRRLPVQTPSRPALPGRPSWEGSCAGPGRTPQRLGGREDGAPGPGRRPPRSCAPAAGASRQPRGGEGETVSAALRPPWTRLPVLDPASCRPQGGPRPNQGRLVSAREAGPGSRVCGHCGRRSREGPPPPGACRAAVVSGGRGRIRRGLVLRASRTV